MAIDQQYTKTSANNQSTRHLLVMTTPGGGTIYNKWITSVMANSKDSFTGYQSSDWRRNVAEHRNATTPASGTKYRIGHSYGGVVWEYRNPNGTLARTEVIQGDLFASAAFNLLSGYGPSLSNAAMENLALSKFYSRAYDIISPVSGGVVLGELSKTLKMLRHPLRGARDLLSNYHDRIRRYKKSVYSLDPARKIRGIRNSNGRQALRAVQEQWLETQFGLIPLFLDIDSVAQHLSSYAPELTDYYFKVRTTGKSETLAFKEVGVTVTLTDGGWPAGVKQMFYNLNAVDEYVCRLKGEVYVGAASGKRFRAAWGVDPLVNFLPTVKELIPYSFLLDYVSNLDAVVQSYSVPSSAIAWWNKTRRVVRTLTQEGVRFTDPGNIVARDSPTKRVSSAAVFDRVGGANQSLPRPVLDFSEHLSVRKLLNISALLGQFAKI